MVAIANSIVLQTLNLPIGYKLSVLNAHTHTHTHTHKHTKENIAV
jgi:hypothetical protein